MPRPPFLDLGQQLPAALVEAQQLVEGLGGAATGQRSPRGPGVLADAPKVEHSGALGPACARLGEPDPVAGRGGSPASRPAYSETNLATLIASSPTTMFWGMIAPEKPPLRIANRASS